MAVHDAAPDVTSPTATGQTPHPSRRSWLRGAGVVVSTVAVGAIGAGTYRLLDTAVLEPGHGAAYAPWQHWRKTPGLLGAVGAAILAASPHNTQPWFFGVGGTAVDLRRAAARTIGTIDPFRREQHVGLGCSLENLVLACRAQGLRPSVQLFPDGPKPNASAAARVAQVDVTAAAPQHSSLHDAIGRRHTDRGPYAGRPVAAKVRTSLVDTAGLSGVSVYWVSEPIDMASLARLLIDAAVAVCADRQQSEDSFAWFRSDDGAVQRYRDGATLDAQGLAPLVLAAAKLLPASSRTAGDAFWVEQTRTVHTRTAAAYGVIVAADPYDRATQVDTGRLLQRIHLTATAAGLALQPLNQITERIDRELSTRAPATFGPRFAALLPAGKQPVVTFRIGYPTRVARPSPRRPVSAVTW